MRPLTFTQTRRRGLTRDQHRNLWFFIFILPFLFGLLALTLFPIGYGFYMSLTDYDGYVLQTAKFVGLQNYIRAFHEPDALASMKQTALWVALNVPLWVACSFTIALILNREIKGSGIFRTLYYLPTVIPAVGVVTTWTVILDQNYGLLNGLISMFRPGTAISWLGVYALQSLIVVTVWSGLGWGMVVFLAGLQGIPSELVEAAKIDGANGAQVFRHITFPLMTPILFFQSLTALIGSFQQLVYPLLIGSRTNVPNIPRPIYFFMVYTYQEIRSGFYGYGLALLWILFVAIIALTALIFWTERFWVFRGDTAEGKA